MVDCFGDCSSNPARLPFFLFCFFSLFPVSLRNSQGLTFVHTAAADIPSSRTVSLSQEEGDGFQL